MEQPGESVEMVAVNLAHMRAQPQPIEMENNPDYPAVRRVSVKAQAGIAGFAIEDVQDTAPIVFRADWYKGKGYRPERMMALRVAGESMLPGLGPDDLVVVNTESAAPKDGCAFLVAYYGEVVVKRLIFDEGMWWLCSDNPDQRRYPRKRCDDGTQIIGEVVYKQSERV
jgi:phage repressor protein C with HTH and peptisase S24 domain